MLKFVQRILWTTVSWTYESTRLAVHKAYLKKKKKVNSDFAMTIWCFWISDCKYVLLLVQVFAIDCFACNASCVCVCVRGTGSHHSGVYSPSEIVLTAACVLQMHTSIITASRLCSPFRLELIKLTRKLKLAIMIRGVTFPMCTCGVWPITMHWVSWPIRADCTC